MRFFDESAKPRFRRRMSAAKLTALFLCAVIAVVFLCSSVYIISHTRHYHDRNGSGGCCSVCDNLLTAKNTLLQFSVAFAGAGVSAGVLFVFSAVIKTVVYAVFFSPVKLKIRLNN
ncbi:MAG: hypothetical protein LBC56_05835 [Oscillospiraceae bacterium]|jgi:glucan phosphoethanolaminetransferase (alkaline phosphatase superfamily)|nr:hypothetical protein [Oscillospiraceae bacterium]